MKHSVKLAVAAVAAAAAGFSYADGLKIIGNIDTGLTYQSADNGTTGRESSLSMSKSTYRNNRVIFLGEETISDQLKAGFWLESGFTSDTGEMDGALFARGAWVYLKHENFGSLNAGRIGTIRSGATPLCSTILGDRVSPLGADWPSVNWPLYAMPFYGYSVSNVLHYASPAMAGFQFNMQYAMGGDDGGAENKSSTNRYAAASLTYDGDRFALAAVADWLNEARTADAQTNKDAVSLTLGGNYDFDSLKVFGWGQVFRNTDTIIALPGLSDYALFTSMDRLNGFALSTGVTVPAAGGKFHLGGTFLKVSNGDDVDAVTQAAVGDKLKRYGAFSAYEYPLSRRTTVYGIVNYWKDNAQTRTQSAEYHNATVVQATVGLSHSF